MTVASIIVYYLIGQNFSRTKFQSDKIISRTKFQSDKILVGQNFSRTKSLVGKNFSYLRKKFSHFCPIKHFVRLIIWSIFKILSNSLILVIHIVQGVPLLSGVQNGSFYRSSSSFQYYWKYGTQVKKFSKRSIHHQRIWTSQYC